MPRKEFPPQYAGWYRIATAAPAMGIAHAQYVRQLVQRKFKVEDAINPNTGEVEKAAVKIDMGSYQVWAINPTTVESYHTRQTVRSGLRRYLVRFDAAKISPESLEAAIRSVVSVPYDVEPAELTAEQFSFEPAYKKKAKKPGSGTSGIDPLEISDDAAIELDFLEASG